MALQMSTTKDSRSSLLLIMSNDMLEANTKLSAKGCGSLIVRFTTRKFMTEMRLPQLASLFDNNSYQI